MNPELTSSVEYAAGIGSSGRWAALNEQIVHYAGVAEAAQHWHFPLFSNLVLGVFREYLTLKTAYYTPSSDDLSLIAWRARNLSELRVWPCRNHRAKSADLKSV